MGNSAQVVVLAEDQAQQNLLYRWLLERGVERRRIRLLPLPADRGGPGGAGEQYVRKQYPVQVGEYRRRIHHVSCWLMTAIDADRLTVKERHEQLEEALREAGMAGRAEGERICVLVPRRNVDTWLHFFVAGPAVDEETDYKRPAWGTEQVQQAARLLADTHPLQLPPADFPPSLQEGWREMKRRAP